MAVEKYTALANITLTSSASSVTFGSIPSGYRDLRVVCKVTSATDSGIRLRFNSDTGSNYSYVGAGGNGTSAIPASGTASWVLTSFSNYTNLFTIAQIMDYSATDKHKTVLTRGESAGEYATMLANRWANTAAITSVTVLSDEAAWAIGSTFELYGVK